MRGGDGCATDGAAGAGGAADTGGATGVSAGAAGGGTSATVAARGARNAAPCEARNTAPAADGGAPSDGRGGRLAPPPLRLDAGTERGPPFGTALFGAALFGAALEGPGARDELRGVGSTESMAAIRSAWVMPDISTAGTPGAGGYVEPPAPVVLVAGRGAADAAGDPGWAAVGEATPPFVPSDDASALAAVATGAVSAGASPLFAAVVADRVVLALESGVPSGALRTT